MRNLKFISLAAAAAFCFAVAVPSTHAAQISVGVNVGAAPACPYGYYDYAPYACAPYGYYGPEWFNGGIFIGAGPWFHGPAGFHGHVNNRLDVAHGYHGPAPHPGDKIDPQYHGNPAPAHFKGNEARDGHGHTVKR